MPYYDRATEKAYFDGVYDAIANTYVRATEKAYFDTIYGPLTNVRVSHNAAPSIVNATATRMP